MKARLGHPRVSLLRLAVITVALGGTVWLRMGDASDPFVWATFAAVIVTAALIEWTARGLAGELNAPKGRGSNSTDAPPSDARERTRAPGSSVSSVSSASSGPKRPPH